MFHHKVLNNNEPIEIALELASITWKKKDGLPMLDYSSQKEEARIGSHTESIDLKDFENFLKLTTPHNFDLMLEIKDKEN